MTIADYNEVFAILTKYEPDAGPEAVYPKHEKIEIYVDPAFVSEEDVELLEERYRVHAAPDANPPHFYVFV